MYIYVIYRSDNKVYYLILKTFLQVNMRSADGELLTDLFVKLADAHKILDTSISHSYYCKKGIPYSQALWLSSICSDNGTFEKRCNNLEQWL